jgi:hypothetical protein
MASDKGMNRDQTQDRQKSNTGGTGSSDRQGQGSNRSSGSNQGTGYQDKGMDQGTRSNRSQGTGSSHSSGTGSSHGSGTTNAGRSHDQGGTQRSGQDHPRDSQGQFTSNKANQGSNR